MQRSYLHVAGRLFGLVALILVFGASLPLTPAPASAQSGSLSSNPDTIDATLALGETRELTLTLSNSGSEPRTARLFEALANEPPAALLAEPELARVPLPAQAERIDPQIEAELADAPDGRGDFLIFLADQPDLSAAYAIRDWNQRGEFVYRTLRDHATRSQAGLQAALRSRGLRFEPFWVANAILVHDGDAADVAALAGRADVALLRANHVVVAFDEPAFTDPTVNQLTSCEPDSDNVCWNVAKIGASRAWEDFGVRGQGVVVANIDGGVTYTHPALAPQYRGNLGNGQFNHNYNWLDTYNKSDAPIDIYGHGTHTMGTMVARGGSDPNAPAVGVAPEARWIAARGCETRECTESGLIRAAQWMLAPTDLSGANPRPDLRPHIVNNSWSERGGSTKYTGYTAAWRAAGIFPVFAAGNQGSRGRCSTMQSPGDYSEVVGVGAVDRNDLLATFSSVGPTIDGRLKPDLTAPGFGIVSTSASVAVGYTKLDGTSMATPHVAAAVALLWSANPELIGDYDTTYSILIHSAVPRVGDPRYEEEGSALCAPTTHPNNIYGWGRLDAYAAVAEARVDVPWLALGSASLDTISPQSSADVSITLDARKVPGPGTYQARVLVHGDDLGQAPLVVPVTMHVPADPSHATLSGSVTSAATGTPLAAQVRVADGPAVHTDAAGRYELILPGTGATYTLRAVAADYGARSAEITLQAGETASLDFALTPLSVVLDVDSSPRSAEVDFAETAEVRIPVGNAGTKELTFTLSVPAESFGVWRSDQPDGPAAAWIEPPASAVTLSLTDDGASVALSIGFAFPFNGQQYTSLQVGADGFLAFDSIPTTGLTHIDSCLPVRTLPGPLVVPLWVDLNPAMGGRVSYARLSEGFLATWEDVPIYSDDGRKLSFQALIRPDGRVTLNYKQVSALLPGDNAAYGIQHSTSAAQSLGCRSGLGLADGLSIELRPQPSTDLWMSLPVTAGQVKAGATVDVVVRLSWIYVSGGAAPSGTVLLRSNDPQRPQQLLTVRMLPAEAPFNMYFPRLPNGK